MTAWLEYDVDTLDIKKVSWKQSDRLSVEIDDNLAEEFILGKKKFSSYCISIESGIAVLSQKQTSNIQPYIISQLIVINSQNNTNVDFYIDSNSITLGNIIQSCSCIFITKKDDPSWLIKTVDLTQMNCDNDGRISIDITNAASYSYFLGR